MKKIFIGLLALIPFLKSSAQSPGNDTTQYIYYRYAYGNALDRLWAKKVMLVPSDTTFSKDGIAIKNGIFYVGNGTKWSQVAGSSFSSGSADSLKHLYVDTGAAARNSYYLGFDSVNRKWKMYAPGSGTPFDSTSLSNRINLKTDSITRSNDTLYYWTNNTRHFGAKMTISQATLLSVLGYTPLAPADTVAKWVGSIVFNATGDSLIYFKGGTRFAVALSLDYTDYHTTGVTGIPLLVVSTAANHTGVNIPKIRDSTVTMIAGDSAVTVATHDSVSANALQTKYRSDTARTNLYNALSLKKNISDSSANAGSYTTLGQAQKRIDSTGQSLTAKINLKLDSVRRKVASDSVFEYYNNGTKRFAYRDSTGTSGGGGTAAGVSGSVQIKSASTGSFGNATNVTADSATGKLNADTVVSHKAIHDSLQLTHGIWAAITGILAFGDSYTAFSGNRPQTPDTAFITRISTITGLPVTNVAVSGSGAWQQVYTANGRSIPWNGFMTSYLSSLNDYRFNNSFLTSQMVINAVNAVITMHFANTANQANGGTGVTLVGTFTAKSLNNNTYGGRGSGEWSVTTNDTAKYVTPAGATSVYAMLNGGQSGRASYDVYLDGILRKRENGNNRANGAAGIGGQVSSFIDYPVVFDNLTAGVHTLTIVKTSSSADTLMLDYFGELKSIANSTPFLLWEQPYLPAASYALSPANSNLTAALTCNAVYDSVFIYNWASNRPLYLIPTNKNWDTLSCINTVDNIHPNNYGDSMLAKDFTDVIPYTTAGYFKGIFQIGRKRLDASFDGRSRSAMWFDEGVNIADRGIDKYRASAGSIAGTTNKIPVFTSTTTIGPSVITQSGSDSIGINQSSPTSVLDLFVGNNGIRVKNANNAIGMGLFSGGGAIWWNRDYTSGNINSASIPAAAIEGTNQGRLNFWSGTTNGAAPTQWWSLIGSGHLIGGISQPSDNTSFGTNFTFQNKGGSLFDSRLIPQNNYGTVFQGDGDNLLYDSLGLYPWVWKIVKSGAQKGAWMFSMSNGTHSFLRDTALVVDTSNNTKITSTLQAFRLTHNVAVGYNATDDGINKFQDYGTAKITDSLKLTKLPNKASLTGTDSALIKDVNGVVFAVPSSALGGGAYYQTVQLNSSSQTQRAKLNFSSHFIATDNSGNGSTDIDLTTAADQSAKDSSTKVANTKYVDKAVGAALINFSGKLLSSYTASAGTNVSTISAGNMRYTIVDSIVTVNFRGEWDVTTANSLSTVNVTLPVTCSSYPTTESGEIGHGVWYSAGTTDLVPIYATMTSTTNVQLICKPPVTTNTSFDVTIMYHQ